MEPARKRFFQFPSIIGVFSAVPAVFALFLDVHHPFWVSVKVAVIVVGFGAAIANIIGFAIVRYRRSSG